MHIEEIKKEKKDLEKKISLLIYDFYTKHTEIEIDVDISFQYVQSHELSKHLTSVNVNVKLSI